eukprot:TRINITY_DN6403_c0_g1_i3.p1 TRINITY_DN6403_c0_g1~~TRINITY_DN6403_c0_g1_i3.p1  ORF type:complete len:295 (-),score=35.46 TRINITY_DN6403_c0_g1_i3:1159-2043(-)
MAWELVRPIPGRWYLGKVPVLLCLVNFGSVFQVILALVAGSLFGLFARFLRHISSKYSLRDGPSFLANILGLAFGIVGIVRAMGSSGVLAVFVGSVVFSLREPTAEEGRYDAIYGLEIIVVVLFFTLFGACLPLSAWLDLGIFRLVVLSATLLLLRRLPVVLAMTPAMPAFWKGHLGLTRGMLLQAAFAGFYGPIGVGALFYACVHHEKLGDKMAFNVVSFVVVASILVHGMSGPPVSVLLFNELVKERQRLESNGLREPEEDGEEARLMYRGDSDNQPRDMDYIPAEDPLGNT